MQFEVKKVDVIGGTRTVDANNSAQMLNIQVGVSGCTYNDIVANKIVPYTFANTLSIQAVKDGINTFAATWVSTNYPSLTGATS